MTQPGTTEAPAGHWWSTYTVHWRFRDNYPESLKAAANLAFTQWNSTHSQTSPEPYYINDGTTTYVGNYADPCTNSYNLVYYRNLSADYLDPNIIGDTRWCETSGLVSRFNLAINNQKSWWGGQGAPGPTQLDVQAVVTHEVGHATGWYGHFDGAGAECGADPHTMCPSINPGTTAKRTVETHDIHTFLAAY